MDVNEWAKSILSSDLLSDKLHSPEILTDATSSSPFEIPEVPARTAQLRFGNKKQTFPGSFQLDTARGLALHYFANHELLAMELMALALLRFQEAPASFRDGIARTILEEQSHLRLYLARMKDLSVEFGDLSVNGFFWSTISTMKSPLDYLARMSLTFEQANLDHALFFRDEFVKVGDIETANLMEKVYREEIGHVKFGVSWFETLRPKKDSFWSEYENQLTLPLSPSRAKGKAFSTVARQEAGLSDQFIRELSIYARSKGRLPIVYEFNPACEEVMKHPGYQKTVPVQQLEADLSSLLMFVARPGDIIKTSKQPLSEFIAFWNSKGLAPIEFVKEVPKDRKIQVLHPWGKTPKHENSSLGVKHGTEFLYGKDFGALLDDKVRALVPSLWFEKSSHKGVFSSSPEIFRHFEGLKALGFTDFVLKSRYGASGRGLKKLRENELYKPDILSWINHQLSFGPIVAEPWFSRVADFSLQLDMRGQEARGFKGVTRLLSSKTGQYDGHILRGLFANLSRNVIQKIYSQNLMGLFSDIAQVVADELKAHDFNGIAGIDLFLYEVGSEIYLKPVCELNPRITMGYVALEIEKYLKMGTPMIWRHARIDKLPQALLKELKGFSHSLLIPTTGIDDETKIVTWLEPLVAGEALG